MNDDIENVPVDLVSPVVFNGEEVFLTRDQYDMFIGYLMDINISLKLILFMLILSFAWRLIRK